MDGELSARLDRVLLAERVRALAALHHAEADQTQALSITEAAAFVTVARAHLAEIDEARRMLVDDPDALFRCAPCEREVERARLEVVSWTRRCASCARADGRASSK